MSDFEKVSNQFQLDLISLLVNFLWPENPLLMAELSGRQPSSLFLA